MAKKYYMQLGSLKVEISEERAAQIRRLQAIIKEGQEARKKKQNSKSNNNK